MNPINNSSGSQISVRGIDVDFLVISVSNTEDWITMMKQITTDWPAALGIIFCNLCLPNHCIFYFDTITPNCFSSVPDPEDREKCEGCVWLTLRSLLVKMSEAWPELSLTNYVQRACRPARPPLHPTMSVLGFYGFSLWSANCGCMLNHKKKGRHHRDVTIYSHLPDSLIESVLGAVLCGAGCNCFYHISLLSVFRLH